MLKMLKNNWKRSIFKNDEIKSDLPDKTVDLPYAPSPPLLITTLDCYFFSKIILHCFFFDNVQ